jgi:hypothetical protein
MISKTLNEPEQDLLQKRSRRRLRSRAVMHWIRRIHLYSGLFMFPWVLLYGITGLLFNHPVLFPDRPQRILTRTDFDSTALEQLTNPASDAELVVAALNARPAPEGSEKIHLRLVRANESLYTRDVVVVRARGAGQEHSVMFDVPGGTALIRTTAQPEDQQAPFAVRGLKVSGSLGERIKTGLPEALRRLSLSADDAGISIGSNLVFYVEADGHTWRALYNVQTGAVTARPANVSPNLSVRQFLTDLHMSHGYPAHCTVRWLWAVLVDAMFASMVFWAISGLFMWWQIKAVRVAGAGLLIVSATVATLLAWGMYTEMSTF